MNGFLILQQGFNGGGYMRKQCEIILNTTWGYCMRPIKCQSIAEAIKMAEETGMAFRIFVDGKCVKTGW